MRKNKRSSRPKSDASRRDFMKNAVLGAGATAAALGTGGVGFAAEEVDDNPISIPPEFKASNDATLPSVDFPMSGAQVFARACKEEGVKALFCCPGNYDVIHAIADTGIPTYGGRHEGALCHAADAFCRATGEVAATSGTEGPGFTDMICAIAAANSARSPMLVLASNKSVFAEDTEQGIQDAYQQPTTEGMRKYGKRLITPARVWEYAGYAFRQLKSGVPKPVHLDFPAEIARARFDDPSELEYFFDKTKYRTDTKPHPDPTAIDAAVKMLRAAERPMIVSSNGVFYSRAWTALRALAEKAQIPVVESGAMKGQFPVDHELSADTAPGALMNADVVVLVGQYCMPTLGEFAFGPDTRYIRIDPSAEDIGRNLPIDLGIVSDEKAALEALEAAMPRQQRAAWVAPKLPPRERRSRRRTSSTTRPVLAIPTRCIPRSSARSWPASCMTARCRAIGPRSCRAVTGSRATPGGISRRFDRARSSTGPISMAPSGRTSGTRSAWPRRCATELARKPDTKDTRSSRSLATLASATPAWRSRPFRSIDCRQ